MATIFEKLAQTPTVAEIAAKLAELQGWLKGKYPTLDVEDPVLNTVWLSPLAERISTQNANLNSLQTYGGLSAAAVNNVSDEAQQDLLRQEIASALQLEQFPAAGSNGEVKVRLTSSNPIVIPIGSQFFVNALRFETVQAYILRPADQLAGVATERLLTNVEQDFWEATAPVVAIDSGIATNIAAGTAMTSDVVFENLDSLTAAVDFVGGNDANSLQDLLDRFFEGLAARTLGTRDQIVAYFTSRTDIGSIRQCGVIGFGDGEMQRDKLDFFPLGGGMADIYLAASQFPSSHRATVIGVIATAEAGKTEINVGIGRDVSPGYMRITEIVDFTTGLRLDVGSEVRGMDLTEIIGEQIPDVRQADHAGLSRFQTATVVACTNQQLSGATVGSERQLQITFQRIPGLDAAQTAVANRNQRFVTGDTLVRAACPLFMRIFVRLKSAFDTTLPDPDAVRAAIVNEIQRRPMRRSLVQADIVRAVDALLPDEISVSSVDFEGTLVRPNGVQSKLTGKNSFSVPTLPAEQITPRTVAMYITSPDVRISVDQETGYETP